MKSILKIGLAVIHEGQFLIVRNKGTDSFLLPGGKPEAGETDIETLQREIAEELSCGIDLASLGFLGEYSDSAANEPGKIVTIRLYKGGLKGVMKAANEIEEIRWFNPNTDDAQILAPSIRNKIVPDLAKRRYF